MSSHPFISKCVDCCAIDGKTASTPPSQNLDLITEGAIRVAAGVEGRYWGIFHCKNCHRHVVRYDMNENPAAAWMVWELY
jgi:hypothetical protein